MNGKTNYKFDSDGNLWVMVPAEDVRLMKYTGDFFNTVRTEIESGKISGKLTATDIANKVGVKTPSKSLLIKIASFLRDCGYNNKRDGTGRYCII